MERELLRELGVLDDSDSVRVIEHSQKCIAVFEETLRAMGIYAIETTSKAVDNSEVTYHNPSEMGEEYAHVSEDYQ